MNFFLCKNNNNNNNNNNNLNFVSLYVKAMNSLGHGEDRMKCRRKFWEFKSNGIVVMVDFRPRGCDRESLINEVSSCDVSNGCNREIIRLCGNLRWIC